MSESEEKKRQEFVKSRDEVCNFIIEPPVPFSVGLQGPTTAISQLEVNKQKSMNISLSTQNPNMAVIIFTFLSHHLCISSSG